MRETPAHYLVLWAIMADPRLSAAAKCVATVLLLQFRNHKTTVCNPSFETIAKAVGRKRRSVIDAINELKQLGWVNWTGTAGGQPTNTNNFQFYLTPQPVQSPAPVQDTTPVQSTAERGAAVRTQPVQSPAHEPSIEPIRTILGSTKFEGVRVKHDSPVADQYRRWWAATGQTEPAYSRKSGEYLKPLPPLPPEWSVAA